MANRILPKRSVISGTVPTAGTGLTQLDVGELGVNLADRRLFVNRGGVIVPIGPVVNTVTGNYTLTASDNNSIVVVNSAAAATVTVPAGLVNGYQTTIIQAGAGLVTIAGGAGITRRSRPGGRTRTFAQYSIAGVTFFTPTEFILNGDTA